LNNKIVVGNEFIDVNVPIGNNTYKVESVFIGEPHGPWQTVTSNIGSISEDIYSIRIFPNPAKDYVEFSWLNDLSMLQNMELVSLSGQRIKLDDFQVVDQQHLRIKLPEGLSGLYILKISPIGQHNYYGKVLIME
jgi:hypothetical protein